jgi:uncharacterized membrane protein
LESKDSFFARFHESQEGKIFLLAVVLGLVFAGLVLTAAAFTDFGDEALYMIGYPIVAGRLGGISKGLEMGSEPILVFAVAFCLEMVLTLFFYPLAIYSSQEASARIPYINKPMIRAMAAAERYRGPVKRWGIVGILFLNWLPIYLTGPLISAIIARLIGFTNLSALTISAFGTALSVAAWMGTVDPILEASGEWAFILPLLLVAAAVAYFFKRKIYPYFKKSNPQKVNKNLNSESS